MAGLSQAILEADREEKPFQGARVLLELHREANALYNIYMKLEWARPPVKGLILEDDTVWWAKDKETLFKVWHETINAVNMMKTPYVRGADIGDYVICCHGTAFTVERINARTESGNYDLDGKGGPDRLCAPVSIVTLLEKTDQKDTKMKPAVLRTDRRVIAGFYNDGTLYSAWPEGQAIGKFGRNEVTFYKPVHRLMK